MVFKSTKTESGQAYLQLKVVPCVGTNLRGEECFSEEEIKTYL